MLSLWLGAGQTALGPVVRHTPQRTDDDDRVVHFELCFIPPTATSALVCFILVSSLKRLPSKCLWFEPKEKEMVTSDLFVHIVLNSR